MAFPTSRSTKYQLNRVHTLLEMILRRPSPTNVPLYCMHEPTTGCNLKCPACPTGVGVANVRETADAEDYEVVCREFGNYLDIYYLFNWGEPTMAKSFAAIARRLRDEPFLVKVSSNFSLPIKDDVIDALATMPNLELRISIDGATQESHQKYRVNSKLATVLDNARRLSQAIKASSTPPHRVFIGFLAFSYNSSEAVAVEKMATDIGLGFQRYDDPLVAGEPMPTGGLNVQEAFGCSWLYSTICPTPKLTRLAPCCGVWDAEMLSPRLEGRSLHEAFMHEQRFRDRRTTDSEFARLPVETRVGHLRENMMRDEGMGLHQKESKVDACVGCTMGNAYQNKLTNLVNGGVQSFAGLTSVDEAIARGRLFAVLSQLVPGLSTDLTLRRQLEDVLDMPPVGSRTIKHYEKFGSFLAGLH